MIKPSTAYKRIQSYIKNFEPFTINCDGIVRNNNTKVIPSNTGLFYYGFVDAFNTAKKQNLYVCGQFNTKSRNYEFFTSEVV